MTLVYRVENGSREGMYTGENNLNRCLAYETDFQNHPLPSNKMLSFSFEECWAFGFRSEYAILDWLYEEVWIEWLHENGYHVSVYRVEENELYFDDERQLVFSHVDKVIIQCFSLMDLIV